MPTLSSAWFSLQAGHGRKVESGRPQKGLRMIKNHPVEKRCAHIRNRYRLRKQQL
jgi:hypothetical protein